MPFFPACLAILLLILSACSDPRWNARETRVERGHLQLDRSAVIDQAVLLNGTWRFRFAEQAGFIKVPGSWSQQGYPSFGVGIYEVEIDFDGDVEFLNLRADHIATEYRVLANGVLAFGASRFEEDPALVAVNNPPYIRIPVHGRKLLLTIEVSNRVDQIGGLIRPILLGAAEPILMDLSQKKILLIPAISVFLVLLIYFATIAVRGSHRGPALLLCCLCLSTALFYVVQFAFFSEVAGRWTTYIHLFDLGWIGACYFFGSYCYAVSQWPLPNWFRRYFQHFPALIFGLTLILPITIRTRILFSMHLHVVISVFVILAFSFIAVKKRVKGSRLFLTASVLMFVAAVNDIIFSLGLIQSTYFVGYVFVFYLMVQAHLLAEKHGILQIEAAKSDFLKSEIILSQQISGIADNFDCRHSSVRLASVYQPSEEAGGDWIFVREQNDQLYFFVADVTDHGLSSALLTIVLSSAVISVLDEHRDRDITPMEIVERCAAAANKAVCRVGPSLQKFSTLSLHCLEMSSGDIHYIQAGHMPTMVSHNHKIQLLHNSHALLGHDESLHFHAKSARLESGSKIFAYTDGLTENVEMKARQLADILNRSADPDAIKASLMPYVTTHGRDAVALDDTTFIALQWDPSGSIKPQLPYSGEVS